MTLVTYTASFLSKYQVSAHIYHFASFLLLKIFLICS